VAVEQLFGPRGVNLIVAGNVHEFVNVLQIKYIHAMIVDADADIGQLSTIRLIRTHFPWLPCLVLASHSGEDLLNRALTLDVFSVLSKPVDIQLLHDRLNRLFQKTYHSDVFA
jgi:DNA-binding NtrC family response regulator